MCYYAVMKLHWKPSELVWMPPKERAMVYAFIQQKMKDDEKQAKKMKSPARSSGRRRGGRRR